MPPLGTVLTRLASYASTRKGMISKAAQITDSLLTYVRSTSINPAEKVRYLAGMNYAKDELLKGDVVKAYRAAKKVIFHAYADISFGADFPDNELNRLIERDELYTDVMLAADLAEFFPFYKNTVRRIAGSWVMRPLKWVTKQNLDPVDLGLMLYTGARSDYLKHYWFDVFLEDKPLSARLKESVSGTAKLVMHAAVEAVLPEGAAPFYFDNVGFAVEAYRHEIEKDKQARQERVARLLSELYGTERTEA